MGNLKALVTGVANDLYANVGEFDKHQVLAALEKAGHDFGNVEELARKQKLAIVNRSLSSITVGGKRFWEALKRIGVDGKARHVRVPAAVFAVDPEARACAKRQSVMRISGEIRRSQGFAEVDGQTAFNFFQEERA